MGPPCCYTCSLSVANQIKNQEIIIETLARSPQTSSTKQSENSNSRIHPTALRRFPASSRGVAGAGGQRRPSSCSGRRSPCAAPSPPPRTERTRLIPLPVLNGHAASGRRSSCAASPSEPRGLGRAGLRHAPDPLALEGTRRVRLVRGEGEDPAFGCPPAPSSHGSPRLLPPPSPSLNPPP